MPLPLETPVTDEWRARTLDRMEELQVSESEVARRCGTSQAAISHVLRKAKSSSFVPKIDAALRDGPAAPEIDEVAVAEVAVLREAADAIAADIVRLEGVRGTIEERLAEAHEHRAKLDIRIRELRARRRRP